MKSPLIIAFVCVNWILSNSCSSSYPVWEQKKIKISLQAGGNIGGITENTDMSVVPGVEVPAEATVDAFSGATYTGANLGVRLNKKLKRNQVELGLDYMYNHQNFNYIDVEILMIIHIVQPQFDLILTFSCPASTVAILMISSIMETSWLQAEWIMSIYSFLLSG